MASDENRKGNERYLDKFLKSQEKESLPQEETNIPLSEKIRRKKQVIFMEVVENLKNDLGSRLLRKKEGAKHKAINKIVADNKDAVNMLFPESTEDTQKVSIGIMLENLINVQDVKSNDSVDALKEKLEDSLAYATSERITVNNIEGFNLAEFLNEIISNIIGLESKYFIPLQVFAVAQLNRYIDSEDIHNYMIDELLKLGDDHPEVIEFRKNHNLTIPHNDNMEKMIFKLNLDTDIDDRTHNMDVQMNIDRGNTIINDLERFKQMKRDREAGRKADHEISKKFVDCLKKNLDEADLPEESLSDRIEMMRIVNKLKDKEDEIQEEEDDLRSDLEKGQEILERLAAYQESKEQEKDMSKSIVECLKLGMEPPEESEKKQKEAVVQEKYKELDSMIQDVFKSKEKKELENIGKVLISGIKKDKTINRLQEDVEGELEDQTPLEWLQAIDEKIYNKVTKFLMPNSMYIVLMSRVVKFIVYKFIDRKLRDYLERELFRLRACEYDVPFYLDDHVSETQDPIYNDDCTNVTVLGYGGLQFYGCAGYGFSGPGYLFNEIIGTEL
jgi:hypothetical protein